MAIPIAISTRARPMLKEMINRMPNGTRLTATATNRMAIASGQGTMPPLMPNVSSDLNVTP